MLGEILKLSFGIVQAVWVSSDDTMDELEGDQMEL